MIEENGTERVDNNDNPVAIEEEEAEEEYVVEAIRDKKIEKGVVKYLIKWEGYPESDNNWEPCTNLMCPELILKFEEQERNKQPKRRTPRTRETRTPKRSKRGGEEGSSLLNVVNGDVGNVLENDDRISTTETLSSTDDNNLTKISSIEKDIGGDLNEATTHQQPKGFERGLSIEKIVGSTTDEKDKIWFMVKWKSLPELELIDIKDMENQAPRELCRWYRERLYYSIRVPQESSMVTPAKG